MRFNKLELGFCDLLKDLTDVAWKRMKRRRNNSEYVNARGALERQQNCAVY